jgi:hypothetical protein
VIIRSTSSAFVRYLDNSVTRRPRIGHDSLLDAVASLIGSALDATGEALPGHLRSIAPLAGGGGRCRASRQRWETHRLNVRITGGTRHGPRRWVLALAAWIVIIGGLSACTGQQRGLSPIAPNLLEKTPTGSPVAAVRPTPTCDEYAAFVSDPEVRAALEARTLWPEVIAELEKRAAGEQVDLEHSQQLSDQLAKVIPPLHKSMIGEKNSETLQLAITALRLSQRSAERLGRQDLSRNGAKMALAELKQAIADYEKQTKAEETRCGSA